MMLYNKNVTRITFGMTAWSTLFETEKDFLQVNRDRKRNYINN